MKEIYLFVISFFLCILFFILVRPLNKLIPKKYELFQPILLSVVFALLFVFLKKYIIIFKENMQDDRINGLEDFTEEEISKCENIYATMSKILSDLKYDETIDDETYDNLDIEKLHRDQFPEMSDEFFEKFKKYEVAIHENAVNSLDEEQKLKIKKNEELYDLKVTPFLDDESNEKIEYIYGIEGEKFDVFTASLNEMSVEECKIFIKLDIERMDDFLNSLLYKVKT